MTNQLSYHMITPVSTPVDTTALSHVTNMTDVYRWLVDHQLYLDVKAGLAPQVRINGRHWVTNRHVITNATNAAQLVRHYLNQLEA